MKYLYILCLMAGLLACNSSTETIEGENKQETQIIDTTEAEKSHKAEPKFTDTDHYNAQKLVKEFYNWFIHDVYQKGEHNVEKPDIVKVNDSTYTLDIEGHMKLLEESGYFSKKYLDKEKRNIEICAGGMENMEFVTEKDGERVYGLQGEIEAPGCEILYQEKWVGFAEDIDEFTIERSDIAGEQLKVRVKLHNGPKSTVMVSKHNNEFKIDSIKVKWE